MIHWDWVLFALLVGACSGLMTRVLCASSKSGGNDMFVYSRCNCKACNRKDWCYRQHHETSLYQEKFDFSKVCNPDNGYAHFISKEIVGEKR